MCLKGNILFSKMPLNLHKKVRLCQNVLCSFLKKLPVNECERNPFNQGGEWVKEKHCQKKDETTKFSYKKYFQLYKGIKQREILCNKMLIFNSFFGCNFPWPLTTLLMCFFVSKFQYRKLLLMIYLFSAYSAKASTIFNVPNKKILQN